MHTMKRLGFYKQLHNPSRSAHCFLVRVFSLIMFGVLSSSGLCAEVKPDLEKRMKLLKMLDKLDEQDFYTALESADRCTYGRNFACAESQLDEAKKYILTQENRTELYLATQRLDNEISRAREEEAFARQLAEEQRQMEREEQRYEAEMEEFKAEQRRLAREMEDEIDHDPYNTGTDWQMIATVVDAGLNAYSDITRQKQQIRREQLAAQQQVNEINRAQRERERVAREQDYYQRKQEIERKQREHQRNMEVRRQENERRQRENQQRQREYAQRMAQATQPTMHVGYSPMGTNNKKDSTAVANASQPSTNGSRSNTTASSSTAPLGKPQTKSKVYEPMPTTAQGTTDMWWGDRGQALELARSNAVNQITKKCRDNNARVDSPSFSEIRDGIAPPRWNYSAPDCRQGGFMGKEWKCEARVSGTCYRM